MLVLRYSHVRMCVRANAVLCVHALPFISAFPHLSIILWHLSLFLTSLTIHPSFHLFVTYLTLKPLSKHKAP